MKKRVLIINPPSHVDIAIVPGVLSRYEAYADKREGRRRGVIFTAESYPHTIYVWHTATQVTIHFGESGAAG